LDVETVHWATETVVAYHGRYTEDGMTEGFMRDAAGEYVGYDFWEEDCVGDYMRHALEKKVKIARVEGIYDLVLCNRRFQQYKRF
jgi:hypothetical protein